MDKHQRATLFASSCTEWETPPEVFEPLNRLFKFNLDPAATEDNALAPMHYTERTDGLTSPWGGHTVFLNPPYGRGIWKWVAKCREEHETDGVVIVALLPARTDTKWFHKYCRGIDLFFIEGRVKFLLNGKSSNPATFPSMLAIYHEYLETQQIPLRGMLVKG